jgi:hypothetical protein
MKMVAARMRRNSTALPTAMPAIAPMERVGLSVAREGFAAEEELALGLASLLVPEVDALRGFEEEVVKVVVVGRSLGCQAIWIMGANTSSSEMALLGTVVKPKLSLAPSTPQDTVGIAVDVAVQTQVWPLVLEHPKPDGQQPTKVSLGFIWNWWTKSDVELAVALHADV